MSDWNDIIQEAENDEIKNITQLEEMFNRKIYDLEQKFVGVIKQLKKINEKLIQENASQKKIFSEELCKLREDNENQRKVLLELLGSIEALDNKTEKVKPSNQELDLSGIKSSQKKIKPKAKTSGVLGTNGLTLPPSQTSKPQTFEFSESFATLQISPKKQNPEVNY